MFRRLPSGLPLEPKFPSDLKGLGYFLDEKTDEIRSIENPNAYFKYFITRNTRWNDVQREMMNGITSTPQMYYAHNQSCIANNTVIGALRDMVHDRLQALGLEDLRLPLGATQDDPHIPILVTKNLSTAKRVILFIGDHSQDLGILAYRIVGGTGGVNAGSMVNLVKYIQSTMPGTAVIIGNPGQLRWWRRGGKAVTIPSWYAIPRKSAVHGAPRFDEIKNTVEGNRDTAQHVAYLLNSVVAQLCDPESVIDIISVCEGSLQTVYFLDDKKNWEQWGKRLGGLAVVAPYHRLQDLENEALIDWLRKRARAYVLSDAPAGIPVRGHQDTKRTPGFGATCYSLGEPYTNEVILPKGYKTVVDWLKEVSDDGQYENDEVLILNSEEDVEEDWGDSKIGDSGLFEGGDSAPHDPWATEGERGEGAVSDDKPGPNVVVEKVEAAAEI